MRIRHTQLHKKKKEYKTTAAGGRLDQFHVDFLRISYYGFRAHIQSNCSLVRADDRVNFQF